ncbi:sialidase family protein [Streptomyces sp. NPDC054796]
MRRRTLLLSGLAAGAAAATSPPATARPRRDAPPAAALPAAAQKPLHETRTLAVSGKGAHTYRIPALTVTRDGTLLAAYDRRNRSGRDLPGDIDIMVRASRDLGRTWSAPRVAVTHPSDGSGVGDPSLLADRDTGRVFLFHAFAPRGVGFLTSGRGNDPESREILQTDCAWSDDDGTTWHHRRLTPHLKDPAWNGMFAASGTGIQLSSGRLLQQYVVRHDSHNRAASAYSDDHGATWRLGEPTRADLDENKAVELADGTVMLNCRATRGTRRLVAYSRDGGLSYGPARPDRALADPKVNAAVLRYAPGSGTVKADETEADWLLFSNPRHPTERRNLTLSLSRDNGRTWPVSRTVEKGPAAYSTMTRLPDGTIALLYEAGPYGRLVFVRFNLAWLLDA